MIISYCFNDDDFYEFEVDYSMKEVYNYLKNELAYSEIPAEHIEGVLKELYNADLLDLYALEQDEYFIEYMRELYMDDAYEAYKEACDYERDPLGYHGLSVHDFI